MSAPLIINGAIRTSEGWIDDGYLSIQNGHIAVIGRGSPSAEAISSATEVVDARNCAVLPGLTNAHTHLSQSFMRGLAGGRSLINWLKQVIWPLQRAISAEELYLASLLSLVENLRCGVTEVVDHHKITKTTTHTEAVIRAARETGLRFTLARAWSDQGRTPEAPQAIVDDLSHLYAMTLSENLISIANGPLALWRCSAGTLLATHDLALQNHSFTHFHVAESQQEVKMSIDAYGLRPVAWLDSIGVLDSHTQIVHAVWVNSDECQKIRAKNAAVVHCPVSNSVLGSGVAPVAMMHDSGIKIKLGTDGAASNDTQDLWETLKYAVCLARASSLDPMILPPEQALSLVLRDRTLEVGSPADIIVINFNHPGVVPVGDRDAALVLGTHGSDVRTVIIDGKVVMRDGKITILDEEALIRECRLAAEKLRDRADIQPASRR